MIKKDKNNVYKNLLKEYEKKQIDLSTKRLIGALHDQKKSSSYEAEFPKKVAIIKVKVKEAVSIGLQGNLERENS
ncbi:MAG: hypothetical protein K9L76_01325 [Candidatus Omnitrophica bacterium]|nr:hypothetical protein [Candidatus Omnitrophota bacterium]